MKTSVILRASGVVLALLLAGCSGDRSGVDSTAGGSATQPSTSADGGTDSAGPTVNPVDVLKRVPDCTIGTGVEKGEQDLDGNFYASCDIKDVEFKEDGDSYTSDVSVTVRAVDPADLEALGYEDAIPDDSHKVVYGDGFYLTITGSPAIFGTGAVDVNEIAAAVGGQII
ncbi:hypothetical protein EUA93_08845 [Nocardioides oleivorans]|uniref:DUF3558 domain-containing protein n=1 Tax=Nocardioides oleivorans TaxID=273676 RepID=A0A4Q2S287_9ACTN|nr:hypothetical protein [Nocardioides oleivorans]RYB94439.1 hypothetical protein EUA93_08845 [Nocardioides oleivorans]